MVEGWAGLPATEAGKTISTLAACETENEPEVDRMSANQQQKEAIAKWVAEHEVRKWGEIYEWNTKIIDHMVAEGRARWDGDLLVINDDRPWTTEYRNRKWLFSDWPTGIYVYMQALRAAGLPAPSFEYEEEHHEAKEEGKRDMTLRIRLMDGET